MSEKIKQRVVPRRYFDPLIILVIAVPLMTLLNTITLLQDIGRPFDGFLSYGSLIDDNYFVISEGTPLWWINFANPNFQYGDQLMMVNNRPYAQARQVFEEAYISSQKTIQLIMKRDGYFYEATAALTTFTFSKFLDLKMPSLILAIGLWLIAVLIYQTESINQLNRLIAVCCLAFAFEFGAGADRHSVFWHDGFISTLFDWLDNFAIPIICILFVHTIFYLTAPERSRQIFSRFIIVGGYVLGGFESGLWLSIPILRSAANAKDVVAQIYIFTSATLWFAFTMAAPILSITRIIWFFRTSDPTRETVYRVRRLVWATLFGLITALPIVIVYPIAHYLSPNLTVFFQFFDMRYLFMFMPIFLAGAIIRYQMFRTNAPILLFVPILSVAGLTASLVTALFFISQPTRIVAEVTPPFLPAFILTLGVSLLWFHQTSWRGFYGRVMYHEKNSLWDVKQFSEQLVREKRRLNDPAQAVADALQKQYQLNYAAVWMWVLPETGDGYFELASQDHSVRQDRRQRIFITESNLQHLIDSSAMRIRTGQAVLPDYLHDLVDSSAAEVAIPVIFLKEPICLLVVGNRQDQEIISDKDLEALYILGQFAALFLENIQYQERLMRIGNELHHTTQQFFHELKIKLTILKDKTSNSSPDVLSDMKNLIGDIRDNAETLHVITSGRFHRTVHDLEIALEAFDERYHIRTVSTIHPFVFTLSPELQHELYMWAKESLNNIVKHAQASLIQVCLSIEDGQLMIVIQDDGKGIQTGISHRRTGGLDRIKSRVLKYHGQITIQPAEPHGTTIKILIPITETVKSA